MGRRIAKRIDRASVKKCTTDAAASHDAATTGRIIGASVNTINALRRSGVLATRIITVRGRRESRFTNAAIETFSARLITMSSPLPAGLSGFVRLHDLPARRQAELGKTIVSILAGEVRCWRDSEADNGPLLVRLLVRLSEIANRRPGRRETLSVKEAAKLIGMNARMIPVLVRAGCLEAITGIDNNGLKLSKRCLDGQSVALFCSRYILTRELAAVHGTSTRIVLTMLKAAGAIPVIDSDSIKGISAVWLRKDIAEEWSDYLPDKAR
jgi:hypothetical protein